MKYRNFSHISFCQSQYPTSCARTQPKFFHSIKSPIQVSTLPNFHTSFAVIWFGIISQATIYISYLIFHILLSIQTTPSIIKTFHSLESWSGYGCSLRPVLIILLQKNSYELDFQQVNFRIIKASVKSLKKLPLKLQAS